MAHGEVLIRELTRAVVARCVGDDVFPPLDTEVVGEIVKAQAQQVLNPFFVELAQALGAYRDSDILSLARTLRTRAQALDDQEETATGLVIEYLALALAGSLPQANPKAYAVFGAIINLSRVARNWAVARQRLSELSDQSAPDARAECLSELQRWETRLLETVAALTQVAP